MKRVILAVGIVCLVFASNVFAYSGGSGTASDPYKIATKADLLALRNNTGDYGKCFILTADINLDPNLPGGQVFTTAIIAPDTDNSNYVFDGIAFTGTFDGNGHKIARFTIDGGSNCYLGLFGEVSNSDSIKNLGIENCSVSGYYYVGGLVGYNYGSISKCYSTGTVTGVCLSVYIGGLAGYNNGSISNCYSTETVTGGCNSDSIGGLVGFNGFGSISDCYSIGTITGETGSNVIGGLVGYNWGGSISNCYSTGTVTGGYGQYPGGELHGGLVGCNYQYGTVLGSFWDIQTSGQTTSNGGGETGMTTSQMKMLSTFASAGWDFTTIWTISEGTSCPRLRWQNAGINNPPVADSQSVAATVNTPLPITLTASDADNDVLTYLIVASPVHGQLSGFDPAAGTVTYTPNPGYTGLDSFTFSAGDQLADSLAATVSINISTGFLSFPLHDSSGLELSPMKAQITSVMDHSITVDRKTGILQFYKNSMDETVTAFTGEQGEKKFGSDKDKIAPSYQQDKKGTSFYINGHYNNPTGKQYLSYDGHPGYDYQADWKATVYAAADGVLFIPESDPITSQTLPVNAVTRFNIVAIDHGNGYSTWYLHMGKDDTGEDFRLYKLAGQLEKLIKPGDRIQIKRGEQIGYVGNKGLGLTGTNGKHLHFEVRFGMENFTCTPPNCYPVDPYGWAPTDSSKVDPYLHGITHSLWLNP